MTLELLFNDKHAYTILHVIDLEGALFYYLDPYGPTRAVSGVFTSLK